MENTLLSTKFYSTLPPLRITQRPRLLESLNECLQPGCKLALVVAPAGYGKSTLVSSWLQQQSMPWSWLSLDEHDNQPQLFLSYLAAAAQKIAPDLEGNLLLQNQLEYVRDILRLQ